MNDVIYQISESNLIELVNNLSQKMAKNEIDEDTYTNEDRLNQVEAANFMEISVQTLIKWKKNKEINLPFIKVGKNYCYSKKLLKKFITQRS